MSAAVDRLYREAIDEIGSVAACETTAFISVVRFEGALHYGRCVSDCERVEALMGAHPVPGSFANPDEQVVRGDSWRADAVPPAQSSKFVPLRELMDLEAARQTEHWQRVHEPLEVSDQARVLLHDGDRLVGWLGVARRGREDLRVDAEGLRLLNRALPRVSAKLLAAERVATEVADAAYVVMSCDGRPEYWTNNAHIALRGFDRLIEQFNAWPRCAHKRVFDGYLVAVAPLAHTAPTPTLITLSAPEVIRRSRLAGLNDVQRRILDCVVAGYSNAETAAQCGMSEGGVKYHVALLCEREGVDGRAQLAKRGAGDRDYNEANSMRLLTPRIE